MHPTVTSSLRGGLAVALACVAGACSLPYVPPFTPPPPAAVARLVDTNGKPVGQAVFLQQGRSVRILLDVTGLPPGMHAVHLHEVGRCDPPSFESSGGHFNPEKAQHGSANRRGPHAGDLPNIVVETSGKGHLEASTRRINVRWRGKDSILAGNGTALIVHAGADDLTTDPDGGSGARIACGPVVFGG
jgi:Cu-Zn family superoxide dismutase